MQLIDKNALVEEIEKRKIIAREKAEFASANSNIPVAALWSGKENICNELLSFLDTFEVKEVDLDKEIETHLKECLDVKFPTTNIELIKKDVEYTAKKFFKLGLQTRIDKELVEEVYSHIDSIKDTADRMTSGNFMHNRKENKMGFHQKCKLAKQCPHESKTMPGTCAYHHCCLSIEEINELTIGCKYTQEEL